MRWIAAAVASAALMASFAGVAEGKTSTFLPAPAYPHSTLAINVAGKPKAGKIITLGISGSNAPFEIGGAGSGSFLAYQLDAFAQNGKIVPNCPRSFAEELQNEINLGINRIAQGLSEGFFGPFSTTVRIRSSRSVRNVVICAYSRLVDDDAAVSALGFRLRR